MSLFSVFVACNSRLTGRFPPFHLFLGCFPFCFILSSASLSRSRQQLRIWGATISSAARLVLSRPHSLCYHTKLPFSASTRPSDERHAQCPRSRAIRPLGWPRMPQAISSSNPSPTSPDPRLYPPRHSTSPARGEQSLVGAHRSLSPLARRSAGVTSPISKSSGLPDIRETADMEPGSRQRTLSRPLNPTWIWSTHLA